MGDGYNVGMGKIYSYKDLIVWQKSVELAKKIYNLTRKFPKDELYNSVSQMRRAAISIPSNIAEGNGRSHGKEYGHFLSIAYGSALELETQLIITKDLDFAGKGEYDVVEGLLIEVLKMLNKMKNTSN